MSELRLSNIKSDAHQLIDALPDGATWDDLMYHIYVRQCIEAGVKDADAGRVVDVETVRKRFGLAR